MHLQQLKQTKSSTIQYGPRFLQLAAPLLRDARVRRMKQFPHHRNLTCYDHSLAVAYYSMVWSARLGLCRDRRSLIRGALLHDYFLYDWHVPGSCEGLHGFSHAACALQNAAADFPLNRLEREIIRRHMFPLNLMRPPRHMETAMVCVVDKVCAVYEGLCTNPHRKLLAYCDNHLN